jgi:hypothetical protein
LQTRIGSSELNLGPLALGDRIAHLDAHLIDIDEVVAQNGRPFPQGPRLRATWCRGTAIGTIPGLLWWAILTATRPIYLASAEAG